MGTEKPVWLKIMENGSIGEATAREFLIDRFWILERSVDIHGADLIFQRRLTSKNILDVEPPRFGVVQVKFFQDEDTTQYIAKEYLTDSDGNARKEFFVLAINGYEDNKTLHFLTSTDILKEGVLIEEESSRYFGTYRISGIMVLREKKYLVTHKRTVLDKIENSLRLISFSSNRRFLTNLLGEINSEIEAPYNLDIANDYGDFREIQNEFKKKTQTAVYRLKDTIDSLNTILAEVDPLKIEEMIDDLDYFSGREIAIPYDVDKNFFEDARYYKEKHDFLTEKILLQKFLKLQDELLKKVRELDYPNTKILENEELLIKIKFEKDLDFDKCSVKINRKIALSARKSAYGFAEEIGPFEFSYYYVPGRVSYPELKEKGKFTWKNIKGDFISKKISHEIMNKVYEALYSID
ncbi:hypothetical protein [Flavobacterium lipolyticum]|uniref:DUF4365 domain-containing protein n=1 Tax=Flavobacterium lipolyticum TaxID=2893754 RepID=A0ABS8M253_9FLAO|nr:hypothetical protein [Flavobacterium sp. F-126]MCC9018890.1 hypothetical protein [Flavobacterium sp. F-126]